MTDESQSDNTDVTENTGVTLEKPGAPTAEQLWEQRVEEQLQRVRNEGLAFHKDVRDVLAVLQQQDDERQQRQLDQAHDQVVLAQTQTAEANRRASRRGWVAAGAMAIAMGLAAALGVVLYEQDTTSAILPPSSPNTEIMTEDGTTTVYQDGEPILVIDGEADRQRCIVRMYSPKADGSSAPITDHPLNGRTEAVLRICGKSQG